MDTLDLSSAEACTKSMDTLEKCFKEAVEAAVNDRLRSDPPKTGTASKSDPFLKGFLGQ